ncbi:hypothetical protein [Streptomyces sp. BE230]|uniref:hypothetical protein n=1 Tax=Streptomyces sp. BE230 TaxID=3002526 RepID=UPI002ED67A78|nr:hypothetical protein [Streptomyces sp. BE230]
MSGTGAILRDGFDAGLLGPLLRIAEEGRGEYDDDLIRRIAVEAIARALGAGDAESFGPPKGVTRSKWSQGLLDTARGRLGLPVAAEGGSAGTLA